MVVACCCLNQCLCLETLVHNHDQQKLFLMYTSSKGCWTKLKWYIIYKTKKQNNFFCSIKKLGNICCKHWDSWILSSSDPLYCVVCLNMNNYVCYMLLNQDYNRYLHVYLNIYIRIYWLYIYTYMYPYIAKFSHESNCTNPPPRMVNVNLPPTIPLSHKQSH